MSTPDPIYPRDVGTRPPDWIGAWCVRYIKKDKPVRIENQRGEQLVLVTHEVCRGGLVERDGETYCDHCGAVPSWA